MKATTACALRSFVFRVRRFGIELLDLVHAMVNPHATLPPKIIREFYYLHTDDHTRIIGINPEGKEVALQGFNQPHVPGLIEKCLETHRIEHPDLLVVVVDLKTGQVDWS